MPSVVAWKLLNLFLFVCFGFFFFFGGREQGVKKKGGGVSMSARPTCVTTTRLSKKKKLKFYSRDGHGCACFQFQYSSTLGGRDR